MDVIKKDILIIGAGGAGLRAAIEAAETAPSCKIGLISKLYPMRSHTVAAEGGAAAVATKTDSFSAHFEDTVSGGDWLCDQDAVTSFVKDCPAELEQMNRWGCPWSRTADGLPAVRPFGGMKNERTWYAADKTGFHMLSTLFHTSMRYPSVERFDEFFCLSLLTDKNGACAGVIAMDMRESRLIAFTAPAVILATGGAGRVFPFTTNGAVKTGDGMAMAYRAGVPLKDMEFVQYHPTGLPGTGILITEAARGEGGYLVNKDGYRYLQDYDLGKPADTPQKKQMELGPRDRLSQAFWHERQKGRTFSTEHGHAIHLDIRHLGEKRIDERLPFVRELALSYAGIDPITDPIPVRPVVHYTMGGVDTDMNAATLMPGLFAAGECACVSINGANRLGSNSLSEILVFGKRAAIGALDYIAGKESSTPDKKQMQEAQARIDGFRSREKGVSLPDIRTALHETMEEHVGIYRTEDGLTQAAKTVADLKEKAKELFIIDKSNVYNMALLRALELDFMLDIADTIVGSALLRKESRGAHQRLDYTKRNDKSFLAHSLATCREDKAAEISYRPVTITDLPPAERSYKGDGK